MIAAIRGDPITMDSKNQNNVESVSSQNSPSPFQRSSLLSRSPSGTPKTVEIPPKKSKPTVADLLKGVDKGATSSLAYATKLVDVLSDFVSSKANIHGEVKALIVKIQKAMLEANKDAKVQESIQKKAAEPEALVTPLASGKRSRPSPELPQTVSSVEKPRKVLKASRKSENEWKVVEKKKTKPKPANKPQPRDAKKVRQKPEALAIGAKDPTSYAAILQKVKLDPALKDLGNQVARIRRPRNGELLFELKGDSEVKSAAFKDLVERTLEGEATVRALTQEIVVECRNIDEITTEVELREALIEQFSLGETGKAAQIKLRKAFGGMQIATVKLPTVEAQRLLEAGKIRVGWTICPLRVPQPQLLRCYRCLSFGHVAKQCTHTDRSKRCWNCGDEGHFGKTCTNKPKCMLCQKSDGNDHATGSLKCRAYKAAKARQGWR